MYYSNRVALSDHVRVLSLPLTACRQQEVPHAGRILSRLLAVILSDSVSAQRLWVNMKVAREHDRIAQQKQISEGSSGSLMCLCLEHALDNLAEDVHLLDNHHLDYSIPRSASKEALTKGPKKLRNGLLYIRATLPPARGLMIDSVASQAHAIGISSRDKSDMLARE